MSSDQTGGLKIVTVHYGDLMSKQNQEDRRTLHAYSGVSRNKIMPILPYVLHIANVILATVRLEKQNFSRVGCVGTVTTS